MDSLTLATSIHRGFDRPLRAAILTAATVLALCLLGIYTRAAFDLASLWPANAVLLGILAVYPKANSPLTWVLSIAAYMAADLVSGGSLFQSAVLNAINLVGVVTGLLLIRFWTPRFFPMTRPSSVVRLSVVILAASIACGISGGFIAGPVLGMERLDGFFLWAASEFVNYAIFLPLIMGSRLINASDRSSDEENGEDRTEKAAAIATLIGSCALMPFVGGAGTLLLHLPAFIWCSTLFRPWVALVLSGLAAMWILFAVPVGLIPLYVDHVPLDSQWDVASFRLGIGFLVLGSLAMVMLNAFWQAAHDELEHRANHDFLTGLLNRRQFNKTAEAVLIRQRAETPNVALAIDIDRFKSINDTHGHPFGDFVLQTVAGLLTAGLRKNDIVGRLGGEEFAIVLPDTEVGEGSRIAEQIRRAVETEMLQHDGVTTSTSVSVGVAAFRTPANLARALGLADEALYEAKNAGRNRVIAHESAALAGPAGA